MNGYCEACAVVLLSRRELDLHHRTCHAFRAQPPKESLPEVDYDAQCKEHGCSRWYCDQEHPQ